MTADTPEQFTIVFDGVCVLCSRWVEFLVKRDPERRIQFAAMQTPSGRDLLAGAGLNPDDPSSFILVRGEEVFRQTDAIIIVLKSLGGGWALAAGVGAFLPRSLRDWAYFRIARNRYKIFGRRNMCYAPKPEDKDRFIL